jgi:hypothetical protein
MTMSKSAFVVTAMLALLLTTGASGPATAQHLEESLSFNYRKLAPQRVGDSPAKRQAKRNGPPYTFQGGVSVAVGDVTGDGRKTPRRQLKPKGTPGSRGGGQ